MAALIEAPMEFRDIQVAGTPPIDEWYSKFLQDCDGSDNLDDIHSDIIDYSEWSDNFKKIFLWC